MARDNNYQLLIQKLDQFIRKYYINKLIRGTLYSIGLVLLLFLIINILEYYNFYGPTGRKVLWYSFLTMSLGAIFYWIGRPLLSYFHLGRVISHEQAAQIIGQHFTDVKDKLLNVLQLKKQAEATDQKELIIASINQKTEDIKLVPFKSAINLSQNRKYLRYALPPLMLFLVILFAAPSLIKDSTNRLINNNKVFEKPAPFSFVINEKDLNVVQYEDYDLEVTIEGEQLPDEAFIVLDNASFRLKKIDKNRFSYQFKTVQKAVDFKLSSGAVESRKYELDVLKKPNIIGFEVKLDYPAYTGRKDESLANIGDVVVPAGTIINWVFNAENTDDIQINFSESNDITPTKRFSDELFTYKKRVLKDELYKLYVSNELLPQADSVSYTLSVIPDLYPTIGVQKFQDSLDNRLLYFVGEASDDYGLSLLTFNYRKKAENQQEGELVKVPLGRPNNKQADFDHAFDLNELELKPGDQITYYFEVFDNDGVNGSKSARTNLMLFSMPTVEEYEAMAEQNDEKIKDELQKALEESRKIQEDMKKMREKLLQQKELDWQDRKELEKMLERQKELEQQIKDAQQAFEENIKNQEEFSELNEEQLEKQQKLQQLFEEVMSDEMQELMRKIQELMQELEKDQAIELMEESEFNNQEIEKELERLQELFKQLEMEQEVQKTIDKLEELAQEQEELQKETEDFAENKDEQKEGDEQNKEDEKNADQENKSEENNKEEGKENKENKEGDQNKKEENKSENKENEQNQENKENQEQNQQQNQEQQNQEQQNQEQNAEQQPKNKQEELQQKQEEINKKFEEIKEQMKNVEEKNEQLETPMNMDNQEQEMEDIQNELNQSQQQLQQQQNKKASQSQKKAAQKMQQMAQQMQQQMQSSQMEQMQEDMQALRQLLENLVGLSFDQEELIDEFTKTASTTPKYVELVQEQFKLKDDFKLIEDSLQALSKRVFQIESYVTEKVSEINGNMSSTIDDLEERKKLRASDHQQRVMKNTNDLALMLSEVMNQMQQQMSSMMKGQQMCSNPNQNQPGGQPQDKISEGQRQLNQEMRQMKKGMEEGGGMSSEEYAKMAARQAALRKALEEKQKKLREQGQGDKQLQELLNKMDKVEKDLVNKQLENETLLRQQDILNRLLQHERAQREREFDQKRRSETAEQKERKLPPALEEYIKKRRAEIELYRTVSPSLKPYYKSLVEEYFKSLKTEK